MGYKHRVPDDACSEEVFAVLSSLNGTRQSAVTPDCAITVILGAFLPSVENCCQNYRKADQHSESRELHFGFATSVGRSGLMSTPINQGARAAFISRSRHQRD
jgi:hypothetical protein